MNRHSLELLFSGITLIVTEVDCAYIFLRQIFLQDFFFVLQDFLDIYVEGATQAK